MEGAAYSLQLHSQVKNRLNPTCSFPPSNYPESSPSIRRNLNRVKEAPALGHVQHWPRSRVLSLCRPALAVWVLRGI